MNRITMVAYNDLLNMRIMQGDQLVVLETNVFEKPGAYIVIHESARIVTCDPTLIKNSVVLGRVERIIVNA